MNKNLLIILTCFFSFQAFANLMIAPTRVIFDDRTRSFKVSLINASSETKTYKIYWRQLKQKQDGSYSELTDAEKRLFPIASRLIRFSPRAVTLKPQERQNVRLSLRKPDSLPAGEYRSHLAFEALDEARPSNAPNEGVGIQVNINMAFSIPVVVKHMVKNVDVKIGTPAFLRVPQGDKLHHIAQFPLINQGNASSYGNIKAYWMQNSSIMADDPTGILNNIAVFTENPQRFINLSLQQAPTTEQQLKIIYEGKDELKGQIIDERVVAVQPSDFVTLE